MDYDPAMPSAKVMVGRALLLVMAVTAAAAGVELTMRWFLPTRESVEADPFFDRSPIAYLPEPERFHPWPGGEEEPLRIAVIGDSITLGSGVQPDDSYGRVNPRPCSSDNPTRKGSSVRGG